MGYGSCTTWMDDLTSLEMWDSVVQSSRDAHLYKNKNVHDFLTKHVGHVVNFYSSDWTYVKDGQLLLDMYNEPDVVLIPDFDTYVVEIAPYPT